MLAPLSIIFFFFNDTATTEIYTLSPTRRSSDLLRHDSFAAELHDTLSPGVIPAHAQVWLDLPRRPFELVQQRSEEHTSELQSRLHLVCRLLLEKKKKTPRDVKQQAHAQPLTTIR